MFLESRGEGLHEFGRRRNRAVAKGHAEHELRAVAAVYQLGGNRRVARAGEIHLAGEHQTARTSLPVLPIHLEVTLVEVLPAGGNSQVADRPPGEATVAAEDEVEVL